MKNLHANESTNKLLGFAKITLVAGLIFSVVGCSNMIKRGQSPDDQASKLIDDSKDTKYISEACRVYGLNFAKIEGIGLVTGINGSGSNPAPSGQRDHLLDEMKSRGIENPKQLLASDNSSMVVLQGLLPPAIKKGDRFDVQVKTLPKSETTSLQHGYLIDTRMRPMALLGRGVKQGHVTGYAKGNVLVNSIFESRQDQPNQVNGWIYGGGVATEDRPIGLTVRTDHSVRTTTSIARAINGRFTTVDKSGRTGVATPKNDKIVELVVPREYRHNIGRYIQVVLSIAFDESDSERVNRLELLDQKMTDPASSRETAVRLEAYGKEGIPALKRALRHHDAEVRFQAAQALAYLGESDGIDILKKAAENEPAFRWHALTAMASSEDIAASTALSELMSVNSAETRYGAFRSLRARSPQDPLVKGTAMDDFFFHVIPSEAEPMLHFARSQRPETVCFGEDQTVADDFLYVKSGLTVRGDGKGSIRVIKFNRDGEIRKVSSTKIPELIRTLSEVGCDYSTLLLMFREAKQNGYLNTRLVVNAVPRIGGKKKGEVAGEEPLEKSDRFVSAPLPELFRTGDTSEKEIKRAQTDDLSSANAAKNKGKTETRWSKMKDWLSGGE